MKICHLQQHEWTQRFSEISETEKDKYSVITYMWNLKNKTNEQNKTEIDSDIENKLVVTSGEKEGGRGKPGVWD